MRPHNSELLADLAKANGFTVEEVPDAKKNLYNLACITHGPQLTRRLVGDCIWFLMGYEFAQKLRDESDAEQARINAERGGSE